MKKYKDQINGVTRRRFFKICGSALAGVTFTTKVFAKNLDSVLHRWSGKALGTIAEIYLVHENQRQVETIFQAIEAELNRLEKIFSLYILDSELVHLNQFGVYSSPSINLIELLGFVKNLHNTTDGAFDPTIQPIWTESIEQDDFSKSQRSVKFGIIVDKTNAARIGFQNVLFNSSEVRYLKPNMAMTLNGIAQGYITDQIVKLLKSHGLTNLMVDIGEIYASGQKQFFEYSPNENWNITLQPDQDRPHLQAKVEVKDKAIASSAVRTDAYFQNKKISHIFNPKSGQPVQSDISAISVISPSATLADGLSTAALVIGEEEFKSVLQKYPNTHAFIVRNNESTSWI